ncbi:MAG TPA: hypothetical protein VLB90_02165 [Pseudomonadales bacterium]|nr:hypothetical protein [Pseudomonadales bacterium]
MSSFLLPEFLAQCCDAGDYISLGTKCAIEKICYGDVRPGGAYYWFSLPVRLGLPSEALIYANLFMLGISSLLSTLLLVLICQRTRNTFFAKNFLSKTVIGTVCLLIHLFFFWPIVFTTLSDPPSSLFLLNGFWLLLFSCLLSGRKQLFFLVFASLFLGLAGWIRAFYFYPVLVGIMAGCLVILISPRRKFWHLLLLFALIPPGFQFANTYQQSGSLAFLDSRVSNDWSNIHLTSDVVGYDSIFQNQGYYSSSRYCEIRAGFLPSLQQKDYSSLFCLLGSRASFYLATYRSMNYIYPDIKNQLFAMTIEDIGNEKYWFTSNLDRQANAALDPRGGMTADKMTAQSVQEYGNTYLAQWVALPGNTDYTFSVWLWSDTPTEIQLAFTRHSDESMIASTMATLTKQPQRFSVSGKTSHFDEYSVIIGSQPSTAPVLFGSRPSDSFYAWGAQLEQGAVMTEYAGVEPIVATDIRPWHPILLAANCLAIVLALLFVWHARKIFLLEPAGFVVTATIGATFAEGLIIIPEQRFFVAVMVAIWILATGYALTLLAKPDKPSTSANS